MINKDHYNFSPTGQGPKVESPSKGTQMQYLTANQAAEYLNVSRRTIQRIVDAGKCKAYQDNRILRFRKEDLDQYMEVYRLPAYALEQRLEEIKKQNSVITNSNTSHE